MNLNAQTVTAKGQLQHHFWGTYCATIVLKFASETDAAVSLEHVFPAWKPHSTCKDAIVFHGKEENLDAAIATLQAHGADRDKVESCAKSIDFGEPFTIEIAGLTKHLLEAEGQQPLFVA